MGRRCCVPGCKGNYKTTRKNVTVFRFPKDVYRREAWLDAIERGKNFNITSNSVVCIAHFTESDIVKENVFPTEDGPSIKIPRKILKLTDYAVPSIFPSKNHSYSNYPKAFYAEEPKTEKMVLNCCAINCENSTSSPDGFSFFDFPENEKLLKKWLAAMKRDNWTPTSNEKLCCAHFTPASFYLDRKTKKKRLRSFAIPTLFSFPEQVSELKESITIQNPVKEEPSSLSNTSEQNETIFEPTDAVPEIKPGFFNGFRTEKKRKSGALPTTFSLTEQVAEPEISTKINRKPIRRKQLSSETITSEQNKTSGPVDIITESKPEYSNGSTTEKKLKTGVISTICSVPQEVSKPRKSTKTNPKSAKRKCLSLETNTSEPNKIITEPVDTINEDQPGSCKPKSVTEEKEEPSLGDLEAMLEKSSMPLRFKKYMALSKKTILNKKRQIEIMRQRNQELLRRIETLESVTEYLMKQMTSDQTTRCNYKFQGKLGNTINRPEPNPETIKDCRYNDKSEKSKKLNEGVDNNNRVDASCVNHKEKDGINCNKEMPPKVTRSLSPGKSNADSLEKATMTKSCNEKFQKKSENIIGRPIPEKCKQLNGGVDNNIKIHVSCVKDKKEDKINCNKELPPKPSVSSPQKKISKTNILEKTSINHKQEDKINCDEEVNPKVIATSSPKEKSNANSLKKPPTSKTCNEKITKICENPKKRPEPHPETILDCPNDRPNKRKKVNHVVEKKNTQDCLEYEECEKLTFVVDSHDGIEISTTNIEKEIFNKEVHSEKSTVSSLQKSMSVANASEEGNKEIPNVYTDSSNKKNTISNTNSSEKGNRKTPSEVQTFATVQKNILAKGIMSKPVAIKSLPLVVLDSDSDDDYVYTDEEILEEFCVPEKKRKMDSQSMEISSTT